MNLAFLLRRARPYRGELALISALALLGALATLAVPWLAGNFVSLALGATSADKETIVVLLVIALVGMTVLNILVAILSELASGRILAGLRREAYDHLQAMPIGFHDRSRSGELLSLMT